jgi:CDP-diacylglycerol--glycerol-3-phosphate 3-phosphatidyltransferase
MFAMLSAPFLPPAAAALVVEGACALVAVGAGATALGRMVVIHQRLRRAEEEGPQVEAPRGALGRRRPPG